MRIRHYEIKLGNFEGETFYYIVNTRTNKVMKGVWSFISLAVLEVLMYNDVY